MAARTTPRPATCETAGNRVPSPRFPRDCRGILLVGTLFTAPVAPAAAGDPADEIAAAETAGSQLLFDYDFDRATEHYAWMSERFPDHPTGPYNLATVIWTRLAQRSNGMRGSSLRNDRFFSQSGRPETTPEEEAAFGEHLEAAYRRADRMLDRNPDDAEALYYRGATEGLESGWAVIVDRAWFRAARTIRSGVSRHRRVQEFDPEFRDAYAVPGTYDYGIATLPRPLRMLAFLFGMRGDREGGLRGVEITANEGRRARRGGLWTYALLMQREEREGEALEAVRRLMRQFPKNPDFALDEVSVLMAQHRFGEARERAEAVLERREAGVGNYRLALPGLVEARLGEALLFEERWERAEALFTRGLAAGPNDEVRAILVFRRGNARDGAGRRPEALSDYGQVIRTDADDILSDWAKDNTVHLEYLLRYACPWLGREVACGENGCGASEREPDHRLHQPRGAERADPAGGSGRGAAGYGAAECPSAGPAGARGGVLRDRLGAVHAVVVSRGSAVPGGRAAVAGRSVSTPTGGGEVGDFAGAQEAGRRTAASPA